MPEQSHPTGAVFISYCSQDAPAAERICEALRAVGVDVWLDKSELRGGDAWDAQIKKHIHDCALFIPMISAHTNARTEGYFRREWKLATRRLLDIADDAAFLLPVVVDETREADARVPEEFFRAQWTRLPGGEMPPAFTHRVRQLLGVESAPVRHAQSATTGQIEPRARGAHSVRPWFWFAGGRGKQRVGRVGLALMALLLILGGGAFWYYQAVNDAPPAILAPATGSVSSTVTAIPGDASIAVLPFVNMSSDPEQEYFSDGLSEQVLNLLSKVSELRVIARTSSFAFKGKEDVDVATIGQRLNVAHVLEGSVRKSGNRVRITAQLINAADSSHQWSETYDRELTDIFAVQDEIALAVVHQLKLALLNEDLRVRSTTTSLEAYNLYLQGRYFSNQGTEKGFAKATEYYAKALAADPDYAEAWAELAFVQSYTASLGIGLKEQALGFNKARASAQKALALNPDLARAHSVLGSIQFLSDWDWSKADASIKKAMAIDPSAPDTLTLAGLLALSLGARDVAIDLCKKAVALDPVAAIPKSTVAWTYWAVGQLDEAEYEARALLELSPEVTSGWLLLGTILLQKGQAAPALEMILKESGEGYRLFGLSIAYHAMGENESSDSALRELIEKHADVAAYQVAEAYAYRGDKEKAFDWLDRAYRQRDSGMTLLGIDPFLENISDDPRYAAMLKKLKLPEVRSD